MNAYIMNGERLLQQGRVHEAVTALQQGVGMEPNDGHAHALLALAKVQAKDVDGAKQASREAARLAPDEPFSHYVLGFVELVDGRLDDAERAAHEAIRLMPDQAEFYRLLAMIYMERRQWQQALQAVDQGLTFDPEHAESLNVRGQVLIQLRRKGEAREVSKAALASSPDDAHSHANAGWTALHNNKVKEALGHFKESLRLDPGNDWAKAGLAEALKARNPLYRVLLGFVLWMSRLDPKVRLGVIVGGYVAYRVADSVAESNPAVAPFVWPLLVGYIVFAWMTWIGMPLADLLLRLSPYGRHALSKRQNFVSAVLGGFILVGLASLTVYVLGGQGMMGELLADYAFAFRYATLQIAGLALLTIGVLQRQAAPRYKPLLYGCLALGVVMLGGWAAVAINDVDLFRMTDKIFLFGFIGMMWFVALGGAGTPRSQFD